MAIIRSLETEDKSQAPPAAYRLYEATLLRDEHFNNGYFKLELVRSQLKLLSVILLVAFVTFAAVLLDVLPIDGGAAITGQGGLAASRKTIVSAALFGIVGAAFSAILSTAKVPAKSRIPEQISARAITIGRAVLGAPAAVLALFLLHLGLIQIGGVDASSPFLILTVAFVAGFSERLILRAIESVSGEA